MGAEIVEAIGIVAPAGTGHGRQTRLYLAREDLVAQALDAAQIVLRIDPGGFESKRRLARAASLA